MNSKPARGGPPRVEVPPQGGFSRRVAAQKPWFSGFRYVPLSSGVGLVWGKGLGWIHQVMPGKDTRSEEYKKQGAIPAVPRAWPEEVAKTISIVGHVRFAAWGSLGNPLEFKYRKQASRFPVATDSDATRSGK